MIGIGFQEVLIVFIATFVLIGPTRLLKLAGQLGRWMRTRPMRDWQARFQHVAWLNHRLDVPPGEQSPLLGLLATLTTWLWAVPVTLSVVGILVAVDTNDHQMLGRSAAVLLVSLVLQASKGVLTERPR